MNHSKTFTLVIFFLSISSILFCQSLQNFTDVLDKKIVGKVFTKRVGQDISQRTFLGTIKDRNGKIKYYVVKEFLRIKAAVVYHGHSSILFFSPQKKLALRAILSMPDELPFKLQKNSLYFKYKVDGLTKIFTQPTNPLPRMICVEPTSCYDVSKP